MQRLRAAGAERRLMPQMLAPSLDYVRVPGNAYTSNEWPLDDGIGISLRG